jgi:hypothetical protein
VLVPSDLLNGNAYRSETRLSPAVDAAVGSLFTVDQRGLAESGGVRNDIGVVEVTAQQSPPTAVNNVSIVGDVATINFSFNLPPITNGVAGATDSIDVIVREYIVSTDSDGQEVLIPVSTVPVATVVASVVASGAVDAFNQTVKSRSAGRTVISVPFVSSVSPGGLSSVSLSLGQGIYRVAVVGTNSDGIGSGGFTNIDGFFVDPEEQGISTNAFEILSSASITVPPVSSPVLAEAPTSALAATILDVTRELVAAASDFLDWAGQNEKWVTSKDGTWYAITPDGTLREWDRDAWLASGRTYIGEVVARLSQAYYEDVTRLTSAVEVAALDGATPGELVLWLDQNIGFSNKDYSRFDGWRLSDRAQFGDGEKWIRANAGQWYDVLSDGGLYRWAGGSGLAGTLIADLPAVVYRNLHLLTNATAIDLDYKFDLELIGGKDYSNWGGARERWVSGALNGLQQWFFVKPDGSLNLWGGDRDLSSSTEITRVGTEYYSGNVSSSDDGLTALHDQDAFFADGESLLSL